MGLCRLQGNFPARMPALWALSPHPRGGLRLPAHLLTPGCVPQWLRADVAQLGEEQCHRKAPRKEKPCAPASLPSLPSLSSSLLLPLPHTCTQLGISAPWCTEASGRLRPRAAA